MGYPWQYRHQRYRGGLDGDSAVEADVDVVVFAETRSRRGSIRSRISGVFSARYSTTTLNAKFRVSSISRFV